MPFFSFNLGFMVKIYQAC